MILIIDDDSAVRMSLKLLLSRSGYETQAAASPQEAMDVVRRTRPDLVLLDMNFSRSTSGDEGLTLLKQIKIFHPDVPVILMTAWGSIPLAVKGIHAGAFDFIQKPWDNRGLLNRISTALELNQTASTEDSGSFDRSFIIGRSPALLSVLDTIERIAKTDASVLIMGENGTGKELIAEAIHRNSRRRGRPMVKVNLGGISRSLFESEMFGHKKGAFTGAVADRKGRFELADKGTIFLDEIGELDLNSQVKLLRVLQEHTFEPLGDSSPRKVDVRVICATNANLSQMVAERTFREDLFYRINLITVVLPPLRERTDDIPLLVDHLVKKFCEAHERRVPVVHDSAINYLKSLPYYGNIRELKNLVERTLLVTDSSVTVLTDTDFRGQYVETPASGNIIVQSDRKLDEVERQSIETALAKSGGNVSRAAGLLGISRQALYRRMEKYGVKS